MNTGKPHKPQSKLDKDGIDYLAYQVAESAKTKTVSWMKNILVGILLLVGTLGWKAVNLLDEMKIGLDDKVDEKLRDVLKEKTAEINEQTKLMRSHQLEQLMKTKEESLEAIQDFKTGSENELAALKVEAKRMQEQAKKFEAELKDMEDRAQARSQEFHKKVGTTLAQLTVSSDSSLLEVSIDLSDKIGPIFDQKDEAMSVGSALAYAMVGEQRLENGSLISLSQRSIEAAAKKHDEWPGEDYDGSSLIGGVKAMKEMGAFASADWPSDLRDGPLPDRQPKLKITSFKRLPSADMGSITNALANSKPVVVALDLTEDFSEPGADGLVKLSENFRSEGSHCVCLVGYDIETDRFLFANSWGTKWGKKGFAWISVKDLQKLMMDAFIISL